MGATLLRLRSDEQLVALFRGGHDEAFRVIHDRYRQRLFAYTRQMLPGSRQDAEDALQDIFVRAYAGLRANDRELALCAWLYRIAHNRCVDELRRPAPPPPEVLELVRGPIHDPTEAAEQRESLRRLIADVRRLPDQQRSALLMRELGGMAYADMAAALAVSVPAVKSLLVRARVGLAAAAEARDTACSEIREELILAHDRGVRPSGMARRHMHDCAGCRQFRTEVRGVSRQFAALAPTLGPLGVLAKALGFGGGAGGAAGGGAAAAGGGAAAAGGALSSGGGAASVGFLASGAGHVATLLAAAVVTAGGAVELQHTITASPHHRPAHHVRKMSRAARVNAPVLQQITVTTSSTTTMTTTATTTTDSVQQVAAAVDASAPAATAPTPPTPTPPVSTVKAQGDTTGAGPPTTYGSVAAGSSGGATTTTGGAATSPTDIGTSNAVPAAGGEPGTATGNPTSDTNSATSHTTTTSAATSGGSSSASSQVPSTTGPDTGAPNTQPTASPASTTGSTTGAGRGPSGDSWGSPD
jgi:RNA polymerase sigma factor (sigma-70 family)